MPPEYFISSKGYEQYRFSTKLCRVILRQLKKERLIWKIDPNYTPSVRDSDGELEYAPCLAIRFPSESPGLYELVESAYKRGIPEDLDKELPWIVGLMLTEPAREVHPEEELKEGLPHAPFLPVTYFPSNLWSRTVPIPKLYRATFVPQNLASTDKDDSSSE